MALVAARPWAARAEHVVVFFVGLGALRILHEEGPAGHAHLQRKAA